MQEKERKKRSESVPPHIFADAVSFLSSGEEERTHGVRTEEEKGKKRTLGGTIHSPNILNSVPTPKMGTSHKHENRYKFFNYIWANATLSPKKKAEYGQKRRGKPLVPSSPVYASGSSALMPPLPSSSVSMYVHHSYCRIKYRRKESPYPPDEAA